MEFALGWDPGLAAAAAARTVYATASFSGDDRPLPPAFSLSQFRLRHLEQLQAGTCWIHAPTQGFEVMTGASAEFRQVELCRMLVGYQGTVLMADGGRRRNPTNGGSVTAAFKAMGDAPDGVGVCHESLWPYSDDSRALAASPPAGVLADASLDRVHQVAEVAMGDQWKRSIFNGKPVGIGIWWPYGWDTQGRTFFDSVGRGTYGHALLVMGWLTQGSDLYWQLDNWHGLLYSPLPTSQAADVPGYKPIGPDKTSDFWVSDRALTSVVGYGNAEMVAAAGLTGFARNDKPEKWSFDDFA